jgi:hypothetical protein
VGYDYIINRGDCDFHITAAAGKAAEATRLLEEFRAGVGIEPGWWPWKPVLNSLNCIIGFEHGGEKSTYYYELLDTIAHLVTPGSVLAFVGQDDSCWTITFDGKGYERSEDFPGIAADIYYEQRAAELADQGRLLSDSEEEDEADEDDDYEGDPDSDYDPFDYYGGSWRTSLCGLDAAEVNWQDPNSEYQEHRTL